MAITGFDRHTPTLPTQPPLWYKALPQEFQPPGLGRNCLELEFVHAWWMKQAMKSQHPSAIFTSSGPHYISGTNRAPPAPSFKVIPWVPWGAHGCPRVMHSCDPSPSPSKVGGWATASAQQRLRPGKFDSSTPWSGLEMVFAAARLRPLNLVEAELLRSPCLGAP